MTKRIIHIKLYNIFEQPIILISTIKGRVFFCYKGNSIAKDLKYVNVKYYDTESILL